jgi:precorrin-6B methylase 2
MSKLTHSLQYLHRHGVGGLLVEAGDRVADAACDRWFGVQTHGFMTTADLGIASAESVEYSPLHYRLIFAALSRLPQRRSPGAFVDFGCGMGRVVVAAAASGRFNRVIGVEISRLAQVAEHNVKGMRHRRTPRIEIVPGDATSFDVPTDVDTVYFYNPFRGTTLERVTRRLKASWEVAPRRIDVVFFNHDNFDAIVAGQSWIERQWNTRVNAETTWAMYRTAG